MRGQLAQPGIQPGFKLGGAQATLPAAPQVGGQVSGQAFFVLGLKALLFFVTQQPFAGHFAVERGTGDGAALLDPALNARHKLGHQFQGKGPPGQFAQVVHGGNLGHHVIDVLAGQRSLQVTANLRIGERLQDAGPVFVG